MALIGKLLGTAKQKAEPFSPQRWKYIAVLKDATILRLCRRGIYRKLCHPTKFDPTHSTNYHTSWILVLKYLTWPLLSLQWCLPWLLLEVPDWPPDIVSHSTINLPYSLWILSLWVHLGTHHYVIMAQCFLRKSLATIVISSLNELMHLL